MTTKFTRFDPNSNITGAQLNLILDLLDGGQSGSQGSLVSGSSSGGSNGTGTLPVSSGLFGVGGNNYPAIPQGLGGSSGIDLLSVVNNGYVQLSWTPNSPNDFVMEYDIQYRKGAENIYTTLKVPGGYSSYKVPNLFPGYTYMFSIRSVNGSNYSSSWSSEVGIPITNDVTAPAVPTGLTGYSAPHAVFLTWSPNTETDLQGYLLQYSSDSGVTWHAINTAPFLGGAMQWANPATPSNASADVNIQFRISATDFSGNTSAYSNPITATTGGLTFAELMVGNLTALGTIIAGGGLSTRVGGTGVGVDVLTAGITLYQSNGTKTMVLDATTGNLRIAGNAAVGGSVNTASITAGTIQTVADVLASGGALMDNSGIQVIANTNSYVPKGTRVWYANVNGQFLSAQYYPIWTGYTPVDTNYGARANFEITTDVLKILKVTISFYCDGFKVGNQTTATSEASHTHGVFVSGQTAVNTGDHFHEIVDEGLPIGGLYPLNWDSGTGLISFTGDGGSQFPTTTTGSHSHPVTGAGTTSGGGTSHSHNLNAPTGLYLTGGASGVHILIYNASNTLVANLGPYTGGFGAYISDVDVTQYITTTGLWQVIFTSASLGGIEGQVNIKAIVQSI